ncbi:MAG: hypothetical protein E6R03_17710 [Hyphomicrobiaceae bacterium]|nr:MAG: hypothetical protein E6R03_17710 [Hyphomicrobiaceae bacterium]
MSKDPSNLEETQVASKSLISKELARYQAQIDELFEALESIKLKDITDPEDKLKAALGKQNMMLKLPLLIAELDNLKNRNKIKTDDIKGNKTLSPLEDGTLDG